MEDERGVGWRFFAGTVLGIAGNFVLTTGSFDATSTTPTTVNYRGSISQTLLALSDQDFGELGRG